MPATSHRGRGSQTNSVLWLVGLRPGTTGSLTLENFCRRPAGRSGVPNSISPTSEPFLQVPDQDELHNLRALLHRMGSSPGPSLVSHLLALWQTVEKEAKENGGLVLGHREEVDAGAGENLPKSSKGHQSCEGPRSGMAAPG